MARSKNLLTLSTIQFARVQLESKPTVLTRRAREPESRNFLFVLGDTPTDSSESDVAFDFAFA